MPYTVSHRAVRELKAEGKIPERIRVRSSKSFNNGIEQDHCRVETTDSIDARLQAIPDSGYHD